MITIPNISNYNGIIPNKEVHTDEEFANNIFGFISYAGVDLVTDINDNFIPSVNSLKDEISQTAVSIEETKTTIVETENIISQYYDAITLIDTKADTLQFLVDNFNTIEDTQSTLDSINTLAANAQDISDGLVVTANEAQTTLNEIVDTSTLNIQNIIDDSISTIDTKTTQVVNLKQEVDAVLDDVTSIKNYTVAYADDIRQSADSISEIFGSVFVGSSDVSPTVDANNEPLIDGAIYFNTVENKVYLYSTALDEWLSLASNPRDISQIIGLDSILASKADKSSVYTTQEVDDKLDNFEVLPSQEGMGGKVLTTDGTTTQWVSMSSDSNLYLDGGSSSTNFGAADITIDFGRS